ncbi:MAG TPA: acyl-CoA thioesterase [Solirubrobacteraceae bacterium]|jgi:acyl-CoA hydrolase|nr:acyl-CoA thioesterase [Solirubrobacteraceae bacterium]
MDSTRARLDPKPVSESRTSLAHWMSPLDANSSGNVHGGTVLKLADEAAGIAAVKHSRQRVVTAGVDRVNFLYPIHIGELVTFTASVNAVWHTSMEVGVRVEAENPLTGEVRHTNTAYFTMVALDAEGNPARVPALIAADATEERRMREAGLRRRNRLAERDQILDGRGSSLE